jgi:hypothetical protein
MEPTPLLLGWLVLLHLQQPGHGSSHVVAAPNITVPAHTIVYMEVPTLVTVRAVAGSSFDTSAGCRARCQIRSVNTAFVNQNYTSDGYRVMKNMSATVVDSSTLTCLSIPTQNGSPGRISVSMDNGNTWSNTAVLEVVPAFEWALSRRPYYGSSGSGGIVYRAHPSLRGATLTLTGRLRPHHGNESGSGFSPGYFQHHTADGPTLSRAGAAPLLSATITPRTQSELQGTVHFSLDGLSPTVYEDFVLTVSWTALPGSNGIGTGGHTVSATKWKRFHRVPFPSNGSNVTMFAVDHSTAGMVAAQAAGDGGEATAWTPFAALGWCDTHTDLHACACVRACQCGRAVSAGVLSGAGVAARLSSPRSRPS